MREIEEEIKNCRKCDLWKTRRNAVPGEGNYKARMMLVGEAPGKKEDEMGKPFVGKAGQLLTETMEKVGIERSEVYITNVIKCRPPNNRNPTRGEIERCLPYLRRQIDVIKPEIIVTLGNFATTEILKMYGFVPHSITRARGRIYRSALHNVAIIPTFHPAACIYNPAFIEKFEEDFRKIAEEYIKIKEKKKSKL